MIRSNLNNFRREFIVRLAHDAQQALLDPEPGGDANELRETVENFARLLEAWGATAPDEVAEDDPDRLAYSRAAHAIYSLQYLYTDPAEVQRLLDAGWHRFVGVEEYPAEVQRYLDAAEDKRYFTIRPEEIVNPDE